MPTIPPRAAPRRRLLTSSVAGLLLAAAAPSQCQWLWLPGQGFDLSQSTIANPSTRSLLATPTGHVIAGGAFDVVGGVAANNIARWDGSTWAPLGTGTDGTVVDLAIAPNGDLVAVGTFTNAGGVPAHGVARWNGSTWGALGAGVTGTPTAVALLTNGDVVVASALTVYRWNGSAWSTIGTAGGPSGVTNMAILDLAATTNGELVVVGRFGTMNGVTARHVARWSSSTASWSAMGTGTEFEPNLGSFTSPGASVQCVDVAANGAIEVGGTRLGAASTSGPFHQQATWTGSGWTFGSPTFSSFASCTALDVLPNGDRVAAFVDFGSAQVLAVIGGVFAPIGGSWGSLQFPYAVCGLPGGPQFAGGEFDHAPGVAASGLVRTACGTEVADAMAFGGGCEGTATVYQVIGGPFPLSQSSVELAFEGFGYAVTHQPGSPNFVAPSSPALPLTDDSLSAPVSLPFSIPYPGGTTNQILVGSNGFVYLQPAADATVFNNNIPGLLDGAPRLAAIWSDQDPGPTGGGSVHVDIDALAQTVTVTWLDVQAFANPTYVSTFQLVASASGDVAFRYLDCAPGFVSLTGWSPGNGARDPGSVDLTLAGTIRTRPDVLLMQLAASARPILGTTIVLETTNVPTGSLVGVTILGFTGFFPGIDLGFLGMPGCASFVSLDILSPAVPSLPSFSLSLPIPMDLTLLGANGYAQSCNVVAGFNDAGLVTSNGVVLHLGDL